MEKIKIAFVHFTKEDLKRITSEARNSRKKAIEIASIYNLAMEVTWLIDYCGFTPEEALREFDII